MTSWATAAQHKRNRGGYFDFRFVTVDIFCIDIVKGKDAVVLRFSEWSLGGVLISLSQAIEPVGWYTTDTWPVRHQTYSYLPSQWPVPIYTAWWMEAHCVWTTATLYLSVLALIRWILTALIITAFDSGRCEWTKNSACYGHLGSKGISRSFNGVLWILL